MSTWYLALGLMLRPMQLAPGSFPKPLTDEQERQCLLQAANGNPDARNALITHNLRLVAHIMKKYYAHESDQDDLISIGTIGLIKAVSTYRMDKNIRLATYASRCIENATLSPTTLRESSLHPKASNVLYGAFWTDYRAICTSFVRRRILL